MIKRTLNIDISHNNAFFLWGPRKTGKTSYLKQQFPQAEFYDLLNSTVRSRLMIEPERLKQEVLAKKPSLVIVDEVQKIPELLDEIHWCLENTATKFILCGSSARKLKHGAANLLGGRAWRYELFSLVMPELKEPDLLHIFNHGLIPQHYLSSRPEKFLEAYVADYLSEEIQAEALVRNVPSFAKFLHALSFSHGELINYSNSASDCGVSPKTVRSYFGILEDTLLGHRLPAWQKSRSRRMIGTDKFYLFDVGLVRALKGMMVIQPKTEEFGRAFEHFLIEEVRAYLSYNEKRHDLSFWRTADDHEVDLIVGDCLLALEFKATERLKARHFSSMKILQKEQIVKKAIIVCLEQQPRLVDGTMVLPWKEFCARLWAGELV